MGEIIEGRWEDLAGRRELRGRKVRVIILEENEPRDDDPWLKSLKDWADNHKVVDHPVDDSRDSIYTGTLDDPR
jgi:hypothetical protein